MSIENQSDELARFWSRCLASGRVEAGTAVPTDVWSFGDHPAMADRLLELVLTGPKRATAGAVADYEHDGDPIPRVGDVSIVTDGTGRPRAVLRVTDVRVGPLSSVDDQFAWDEGEGDRTRASWLEAHSRFFARYLPTIGVEYDDDMATVFERFEVVYSE